MAFQWSTYKVENGRHSWQTELTALRRGQNLYHLEWKTARSSTLKRHGLQVEKARKVRRNTLPSISPPLRKSPVQSGALQSRWWASGRRYSRAKPVLNSALKSDSKREA